MTRPSPRATNSLRRTPVLWSVLLGGALVTDAALSLEEVGELAGGQEATWGAVSLLSHACVLVAGLVLARSYFAVRRELFQRDQAIAAASATSADWLWETDAAGRLTYASEGVRILLGYEPMHVVGKLAQELLAPEARDEGGALPTRSADARSGLDPVELPWLHADGHVVVLQGAAAPIMDKRGIVTGFRGTRRRLTEAMVNERQRAAARTRMTSVLAEARLTVALQPIIDFRTGRVAGVEALTRFGDGRPPDVWFREAVETGLGRELDQLTFANALTVLAVVPDECFLSINATPELLNDEAFQRRLLQPDMPANRLVLEITEHERVTSYEELAAALVPLRERGVRLAVDDTGAGYASLSHVLQLRPDIIKLDRSLVSHVTNDPARRVLVTALVLLAMELGAELTAEGVETSLELETLASLGVDHAQGYLLSRPSTDRDEWAAWWDRQWLPGEAGPALPPR